MADSIFVPVTSTIEAATIYLGGDLVARDQTVALPEVTPATADVSGLMGTISVPLLNTLEDMEMTITKRGVDANMAKLTSPGTKDLSVRWVQDVIDETGTVTPQGCKAEVKCMPKTYAPGMSVEVGEVSEGDIAFAVYAYKLVVDGKEVFNVNRLTGTLKALNAKGNLTDFSKSFKSFL